MGKAKTKSRVKAVVGTNSGERAATLKNRRIAFFVFLTLAVAGAAVASLWAFSTSPPNLSGCTAVKNPTMNWVNESGGYWKTSTLRVPGDSHCYDRRIALWYNALVCDGTARTDPIGTAPYYKAETATRVMLTTSSGQILHQGDVFITKGYGYEVLANRVIPGTSYHIRLQIRAENGAPYTTKTCKPRIWSYH